MQQKKTSRQGRPFCSLSLFREESGKLIVIGETKSVCFFAHYLIELCESCLVVRLDEDSANAAAKCSKKIPADEGKLEDEDLPFFAPGHEL